MLNRINILIIALITAWNAYDVNQLKQAKSVLTVNKINAYEYLLVDHEKEINKLKKAIVNIDAKCYNNNKQGGNNAKD
jgi:hypothetical protein